MLYIALAFMASGAIVGAWRLSGTSPIESRVSGTLFLIGMILVMVHLIWKRGAKPAS